MKKTHTHKRQERMYNDNDDVDEIGEKNLLLCKDDVTEYTYIYISFQMVMVHVFFLCPFRFAYNLCVHCYSLYIRIVRCKRCVLHRPETIE